MPGATGGAASPPLGDLLVRADGLSWCFVQMVCAGGLWGWAVLEPALGTAAQKLWELWGCFQ